MIIQTRELGYGENYTESFEVIKKWKDAVERKYPEIKITLMYNLAGERGRLKVQTTYPSLAEYERIDAALDDDEEIGAVMGGIFEHFDRPMIDQFYRVID